MQATLARNNHNYVARIYKYIVVLLSIKLIMLKSITKQILMYFSKEYKFMFLQYTNQLNIVKRGF